MVTTIAVVGDIIPPRDRGRYQGLFGAVFGVSTVIGPLLGGFFVDNLSWRWIFYVNLPLGAAAFVVIGGGPPRAEHGAARASTTSARPLLAGALTSIVLFTSLGGTTYDWGSPAIVSMMVVGLGLLVLFPFVEARAAEPILPLELFRNRTFAVTSAIGFIVGLALFGVDHLPAAVPPDRERERARRSPGLQLTPLMAGLLVTSILSGNAIARTGRYKPFPIVGTAVMTVGVVPALAARRGDAESGCGRCAWSPRARASGW